MRAALVASLFVVLPLSAEPPMKKNVGTLNMAKLEIGQVGKLPAALTASTTAAYMPVKILNATSAIVKQELTLSTPGAAPLVFGNAEFVLDGFKTEAWKLGAPITGLTSHTLEVLKREDHGGKSLFVLAVVP